MRLATRPNGTPDGELVVVSQDGARCLPAGDELPNLLGAMGDWQSASASLNALAGRLAQGEGEALDIATLAAPMPRSWQWLDGSAFETHAELMQIAFQQEPLHHERPLMYQGMSHCFLGGTQEVAPPTSGAAAAFQIGCSILPVASVEPAAAIDHAQGVGGDEALPVP